MIIVFIFLLVMFANNDVAYKQSLIDGETLAKVKSIAVGNLIQVIFWTTIEFAICFEWEVITALVKFQSTCSLTEMGVKKQYFNEKHEGFVLRWHIVMNILNLLFNTLVILVVLNET